MTNPAQNPAQNPAPQPDFTPDDLEAAGAPQGQPDPGYVWPTDPRTLAALEHWQDLKFGVIIHWGLYALIDQCGSWSLCREDMGDFMDPPASYTGDLADYRDFYTALPARFEGADYDPTEWATLCRAAGMKYLVFTTKHHDGFNLFDTKLSDYKVTNPAVPIGYDVLRKTLDAYRAAGLETGLYFSKADWGCPDYWDPERPVPDRYHNYDRAAEPEKWQRFVDFTHGQIRELLTQYGDISVLWLDAGWVGEPHEPIAIDELADTARSLQPDILVVDREVHGRNENYRTPEQRMPSEVPGYPWESCITMTRGWCSMQVDDPAKATSEIIATLVKIVGMGGNYLLGIGPDATGALSRHIVAGLTEVGAWMRVNSPALYSTRTAHGRIECRAETPGVEWSYTHTDTHVYCLGVIGDAAWPGGTVTLRTAWGLGDATVLGSDAPLTLVATPGGYRVDLPAQPGPYAFALAIAKTQT